MSVFMLVALVFVVGINAQPSAPTVGLWVFRDRISTSALSYVYSSDAGMSWGNDVSLSTVLPFSTSVVFFPVTGNMYAYHDTSSNELFVTASAGSSWSSSVDTLVPSAGSIFRTPSAVVYQSKIFVFFRTADQSQVQYVTTVDGANYSAAADVPILPILPMCACNARCKFGTMPAAAVFGITSELWLYYIDGKGLLNYISFDGSRWTGWAAVEEKVVSGANPNMSPTMVNFQNNSYIFFPSTENRLCYTVQSAACTFSNTTCTNAAGPVGWPAAVVYVSTIFVVYQGPSYNYYFTKSNDGATFDNGTIIATAAGAIQGNWAPSVVVN